MEALTFSRINASLASSRRLSAGNDDRTGSSNAGHGVEQPLYLQRARTSQDGRRLFAVAHYGGDPAKYDTARVIVLYTERNSRIADAVENRIFKSHDRGQSPSELFEVIQHAMSSVPHFFPTATRITFRTQVDGEPTYSFSEETEEIDARPALPSTLTSFPTVQITSLEKLSPMRYGTHVDRVSWQGREYAFKQCTKDAEDMLVELEILTQVSSTRLQRLVGLVVDNEKCLRGFLAPFMPYGSIEEVFKNLAHPDTHQMEKSGNIAYVEPPSWTTKLRWARQIAGGIADLHGSALGPITLGNFNPRNVLIDDKGDAVIIGLSGSAQGTRFPERWAAPERLRSAYSVGPPLDIANLGMVFWALAEEDFGGFPRSERYANGADEGRRSGRWRRRDSPAWFKVLVDSCAQDDPSQRPTAAQVLAALEKEAMS